MSEVTAPTAVLRVADLHVRYRAGRSAVVHAVRGIGFELRPGQRIGVVGESGSGKSSIALAMLGLIEPPSEVTGTVAMGGRNLAALSDRQLNAIRGKEIGLVYQDPMSALDPLRTIGRQIVDALAVHRRGATKPALRAEAVRLLGEVEVPDPEQRFDDYPHEYSGGMRQRVAIAMAIANNPRVLLADEPTTALDVTTQASVMHLLVRLAERHRSALVLITHNLGLVAEYCDEVLVVYGGRIVERGHVTEVFAAPAHPYTEALLASVPRPGQLADEPLAYIEGLPPNLRRPVVGCSFAPRCPYRRTLADPTACDTLAPAAVAVPGRDSDAECHYVAARMTSGVGR